MSKTQKKICSIGTNERSQGLIQKKKYKSIVRKVHELTL